MQQLKKIKPGLSLASKKILHQWARRIARLQCDHAEWWQSPSLPGGPYGSLQKKKATHFPRTPRSATTPLSRDKGEFWTACRGMWPNMHISVRSCAARARPRLNKSDHLYNFILKRRRREREKCDELRWIGRWEGRRSTATRGIIASPWCQD